MFCPNCGTNNPDGSKFCSECGAVFNAEAPAAADTKQTVDQIIEGIAPSQSAEGEKPTVDQIIDEIKPEKTEEPAPVAEQPAPVPEQPAPVSEQPVPVSEQPVPVPEQPVPVPEQPVPAPEQPVQQVSVPVQPAPQQIPQQPMPQYQPQPPAYAQAAAPVAPKPPKPPRKPLDAKQKKLLIIGGSCAAVLVAFLIVLFAAIIPHSGLKGKLRYSWTRVDSTRSVNVLNLKKKSWTVGSKTYKITNWNAKGDRLVITYTDGSSFDSDTYVVAFSPDGKKIYLFDSYGYDDGDRPEYVFARGQYVQTNALETFPW